MPEKTIVDGPEGFFKLAGKHLFTSEPFEITRAGIEEFCRATGNEEWQTLGRRSVQSGGIQNRHRARPLPSSAFSRCLLETY